MGTSNAALNAENREATTNELHKPDPEVLTLRIFHHDPNGLQINGVRECEDLVELRCSGILVFLLRRNRQPDLLTPSRIDILKCHSFLKRLRSIKACGNGNWMRVHGLEVKLTKKLTQLTFTRRICPTNLDTFD